MIELKELSFTDKHRVLAPNIDLKLPNGKLYGVLSPSKGDSARFLATLAGTLPYTGQIKINGFDLRKQPKKARQCIGFLPSDAPLYLSFNTVDALSFVAQSKGVPYERAMRQIHELTEAAALTPLLHRVAASMDETDRRLLGILQAAMGDSDILLLTAPTKGLDEQSAEEVFSLIEYLSEKHTVFVSADTPSALPEHCDHILLLHEEKVIQDPTREELDTLFSSLETSKSESKNERRVPERDGEYELISDEEEE